MSYMLVSNGTNSGQDAMKFIGLMSTSGITDGLKPAFTKVEDGSYLKLFSASIIHLKDTDQLDTSIIHGDGSNTVVKKGAPALVTQGTNTRKETKNSP